MKKPAYVLPNTSEMNKNGRGSLSARFELATELRYSLVEVPADFIKNGTEVRLTGLKLGDRLTEDAIRHIYASEEPHSDQIGCIFHTEPSLPRKDGNGYTFQAPLRWHDRQWVISFIRMILQVSNYLRVKPWAIEIHPGQRQNSYADVAAAAGAIHAAFADDGGYQPLIVLENRTGQFINSGESISEYWASFRSLDEDMVETAGVVVDIQQLYTAHARKFDQELAKIPVESVKGLHIHSRHRVPKMSDDIPWGTVAEWILELDNLTFINPEIHHGKHIAAAIQFCDRLLQKT